MTKMKLVSALGRKLFRDLWHMRAQTIAIAAVVAAGVAIFVAALGTISALERTQADYYARYRLADIFARAVRAPRSVIEPISALPGVTEVLPRVVVDVAASVPDFPEPVTIRLVSIPPHRASPPNGIHLRSGTLPMRDDELVLNEVFAEADHLEVGSSVRVTIHGQYRNMRVVGIGMSPEYVFQMSGTEMLPDNRRFGVAWMNEDALASAMDMSGAFNDLSLVLAKGAPRETIIARVDELLAPYGGVGAGGREDLLSHRYLTEEFRQLDGTARAIPIIFLGVAAFLLNVVLARLIAMQRAQIGTLKAFGYSNFQIGLHYLEIVIVITLLGAAAGVGVGVWMGKGMTALYQAYYRFPNLTFSFDPRSVATSCGIALVASVVGAIGAVRRAVNLPPAEAMRPEPPPIFHGGSATFSRLLRLASTSLRMTLRNLGRRPARTSLSVLGVAMAAAILVVGGMSSGAIDYIFDIQFNASERQDITVLFAEARERRANFELAALPGVLRVEPFRGVPVTLHNGPRSKKSSIMGLPRDAELKQLVDSKGRVLAVPPEGLVLSKGIADVLGVRLGDDLEVEITDGDRRIRHARVSAIIDDLFGLSVTMDIDALARLAGGPELVSGAYLKADAQMTDTIFDRLKKRGMVASVSLRKTAMEAFHKSVEENMMIFYVFEIVLAVIIAFSVVFNNARIALSERARELATMRVLGFSEAETAAVLIGEITIVTALAIPLGLGLGYVFAIGVATASSSELMRLPVVIEPSTYALAAIVVVASSMISTLIVRQRIARLDLVGVLKTRD